MKRSNPCRGRYAGCTADPEPGRGMCKACAATHARKGAEKRAARKRECACWVCGARAAVVDGVTLSTCPAHREYFAERARAC